MSSRNADKNTVTILILGCRKLQLHCQQAAGILGLHFTNRVNTMHDTNAMHGIIIIIIWFPSRRQVHTIAHGPIFSLH